MNVDAFVLCDSVELPGEGRFTIRGEQKEFVVARLPATSPPVSLLISLTFQEPEAGKRNIVVESLDPAGNEAWERYELGFGIAYEPGKQTSSFSIVIPDLILEFRQHGQYVARLLVDQREVATWPFVVTLLN